MTCSRLIKSKTAIAVVACARNVIFVRMQIIADKERLFFEFPIQLGSKTEPNRPVPDGNRPYHREALLIMNGPPSDMTEFYQLRCN